jgi:DNA-binding transcriptional ArsR family regulator
MARHKLRQREKRSGILAFFCNPVLLEQAWLESTQNPYNAKPPMSKSNEILITEDADIVQAAYCLKAMSHPLRLKILCTLGSNKVSVQDIVEQVGTTQSNISQHLGILRDKGILACKKDANRVYYYVDDERTLQLIKLMKEVFCHH